VSAISFEGTECRLIEISRVVQATGGEVSASLELPLYYMTHFMVLSKLTRVDPTGISQEFSAILANPAIAINVACRVIAHKDMYVLHRFLHSMTCTLKLAFTMQLLSIK